MNKKIIADETIINNNNIPPAINIIESLVTPYALIIVFELNNKELISYNVSENVYIDYFHNVDDLHNNNSYLSLTSASKYNNNALGSYYDKVVELIKILNNLKNTRNQFYNELLHILESAPPAIVIQNNIITAYTRKKDLIYGQRLHLDNSNNIAVITSIYKDKDAVFKETPLTVFEDSTPIEISKVEKLLSSEIIF